MDNTITHLMLNHLPQILPIIGFILLLIGVFSPSEIVKRTSYSFFILGGFLGVLPNILLGNSIATDGFSLASIVLGIASTVALFASLRNLDFSKFSPLFVAGISVFTLFFAHNSGNFSSGNNQNSISTNSTNSPKTLENLVDANSGATKSSEISANNSEPISTNSVQEIRQNYTPETTTIDANSGATRSSNYIAKNEIVVSQKSAKPLLTDANSGATKSNNGENEENGENYYAKNHHKKHKNDEFEENDDD